MADVAKNGRTTGRLSSHDVAQLTEQLAGLSAAGLPLPSGLRALAEEQPSRSLRRVLNELSVALDSGTPLGPALDAQGSRLPSHLKGLVVASLRSDRLAQALGRFVMYGRVGSDLRRRLWLALAYPVIASCLASALFGYLVVMLASEFGTIFQGFRLATPMSTQLLIALAEAVQRFSTAIPFILGIVVVSILAIFLTANRARRRSMAGRIPLVGWVWRLTALAEFCHLLALLVENDVPLAEAVTMTGEGVEDATMTRASRTIAEDLMAGQSLARSIETRSLFPRGLSRVLEWAEKHHSLPESLHMAGELFEARARALADLTILICNVLAVIVITLGILFIFSAIVVPMMGVILSL